MSNATIYKALLDAGMTKEGVCAMLGNMAAESGMKPNIAQRGMTTLLDEAYTEAADNGLIDFAHDSVGYGLCQWTLSTRKAALLSHAKARGLSVGDETAQVTYCIVELMKDFPDLWQRLCSSHDLLQLTQAVCTEYERPAHPNVGTRYEYAQQAYDYFGVVNTGMVEDACPIDGPCEQPQDIDLKSLAAFLQTPEFAEAYSAWRLAQEEE